MTATLVLWINDLPKPQYLCVSAPSSVAASCLCEVQKCKCDSADHLQPRSSLQAVHLQSVRMVPSAALTALRRSSYHLSYGAHTLQTHKAACHTCLYMGCTEVDILKKKCLSKELKIKSHSTTAPFNVSLAWFIKAITLINSPVFGSVEQHAWEKL